MRKAAFNSLPFGLYRVYWKGASDKYRCSLASVGNCGDGQRWLAPCNWIGHNLNVHVDGNGSPVWPKIEKMELLVDMEETNPDLGIDCPICGAAKGHQCGYMASTGDPKQPLRNQKFPNPCPVRVSIAATRGRFYE